MTFPCPKVMMGSTPDSNRPLGQSLLMGRDFRLIVTNVEGANDIQPIIDRCASREPSLRPKAAEVLEFLIGLEPAAAAEVRSLVVVVPAIMHVDIFGPTSRIFQVVTLGFLVFLDKMANLQGRETEWHVYILGGDC